MEITIERTTTITSTVLPLEMRWWCRNCWISARWQSETPNNMPDTFFFTRLTLETRENSTEFWHSSFENWIKKKMKRRELVMNHLAFICLSIVCVLWHIGTCQLFGAPSVPHDRLIDKNSCFSLFRFVLFGESLRRKKYWRRMNCACHFKNWISETRWPYVTSPCLMIRFVIELFLLCISMNKKSWLTGIAVVRAESNSISRRHLDFDRFDSFDLISAKLLSVQFICSYFSINALIWTDNLRT